ncbi:MAG: P-II family nitrogen regulator [Clostridia bacterium]|nr:P-II family nitrogen regulator [Clostridia bacterium]
MKYAYETIFCIVNSGYSEAVMDAAKKFGARGGTVLNARGTASKDAEKFFGITVQPEKEIVMILVPSNCKDDILHALYKEVGLDTPGQGIAFSMPVDSVVGLSQPEEVKKDEPKPTEPKKIEKKEE